MEEKLIETCIPNLDRPIRTVEVSNCRQCRDSVCWRYTLWGAYLIAILALGCSIHTRWITWSTVNELTDCKLQYKELQVQLEQVKDVLENSLGQPDLFLKSQDSDVIRAHDLEKREARKRGKKRRKHHNKRKHRKCKCNGSRGKRGLQGAKGEQGPSGTPGPAAIQISSKGDIVAAHYTARFWEDLDESFTPLVDCVDVEKWNAVACRSRTVKMKSGNIKFFHPANWTVEHQQVRPPAEQLGNGEFKILHDGLYMLYCSVLFIDDSLKQGQAVTINGRSIFKCMDSMDYWDEKQDERYNSRYKSCSLTGVTFLNAGDKIAVRNLYGTVTMDLNTDATYFGIVQLAPGGVNEGVV